MAEINRQWLLAKRPVGMVSEANFEYRESPVPKPSEGEVLVRNLYLSFDPAMRGWMEDRESYLPPVAIGAPMRAGCIGQIVESKHAELKPGDLVQGMFGWQDYAVTSPTSAFPPSRVPAGISPTLPLGPMGITGFTAYFGLLDLGEPKPGQTVVVSGAAGATGSVAAQIARIKGCRVIGIAGGPEKCQWLLDKARIDAAVDYKSEDVEARLRELCPDGIDVYFDNVGGRILEIALGLIAQNARVVLCGGISGYNEEKPSPGPNNLMNLIIQRGRMEGFIVLDYLHRAGEAIADLSQWILDGEIAYEEDIQEGLENAPQTFLRLFEGKNLGKQLLKIAEAPL
jgi:NADPH-dependent curcumin reductase CurA